MTGTDNGCLRDLEYHFFGGLWLERPEDHLNDQELADLRELEPLIHDLESYQKDSHFDMAREFTAFSERETTKWKDLGAERSPGFLLHPSGDIGSPVACHLHNPTFYVKNPYCQETDNCSNPTIQQLNQAGFSSKNCLFLDHICRRDRTDDVLLFYNADILKIHEDFVLSIRKAMAAKVEICWGRHVRERMKKLLNLQPLRLWGEFRDVELYLEIHGQRILRFILFVAHPQFFFYHGSFTESGLRFRETQAKRQDLSLTVASKLGGIKITPHFYERIHRPALYGQFDKFSRSLVVQLEAEADTQLRAAFPIRYEEIESSVQIFSDTSEPEKSNTPEPVIQHLTLSETIERDSQKECSRRLSQFVNLRRALIEAVGQIFVDSFSLRSWAQGKFILDTGSEWDEASELDQLPVPLLSWIQSQDGLKMDQIPISSKEELFVAYDLLSPPEYKSTNKSLITVALKVATWYIQKINRQRHPSVQDLIVPGVQPYNIMRRKCAKCGDRVLDDAFACFARADPTKYVIWYRRYGCGRHGCRPDGMGFANLVPLDPSQGYRVATRKSLQCLRTGGWEEYLLRCTPQERSDVQQIVQTTCKSCKKQPFEDTKPRWTSQTPSRYVIPVRGCECCKERFSSFIPIDSGIRTITKSALSKKWKDLKTGGIEPADYPRRPDILWSRKTHLTKLKELEYVRELSLQEDAELRLPPSLNRKRNFNSKNRGKP